MNKKGGVIIREDTCGGFRVLLVQICTSKIMFGGGGGERIFSLASYLGMLHGESEELLNTGKLSKIRSWYNNLGMCVETHRDHSINWISFEDAFSPLKWAHLPRHQIIGEISVLIGFAVQVVAGCRSQLERRFD